MAFRKDGLEKKIKKSNQWKEWKEWKEWEKNVIIKDFTLEKEFIKKCQQFQNLAINSW